MVSSKLFQQQKSVSIEPAFPPDSNAFKAKSYAKVFAFQSSRRFRQIPTVWHWLLHIREWVSIEPAFPPDSNKDEDNGFKKLEYRFNRAGVSARFQPPDLGECNQAIQEVSIEPAFPPDSNFSTKKQIYKAGGVSIEPAFPPDSNVQR